jgi:hypothetical protein
MACGSCSNKRGESSHENRRVKFVSRRNPKTGETFNIEHSTPNVQASIRAPVILDEGGRETFSKDGGRAAAGAWWPAARTGASRRCQFQFGLDERGKLKEPNAKDEPFEDVVKSAQDAAVLVLVY